MALAFHGDPDFIRRSINFAANYLVTDKSEITQETVSFAQVNTTMEGLADALEREGYNLKMVELLKDAPCPILQAEDEDFPDDWEKRMHADFEARCNAKDWQAIKEIDAKDPTNDLTFTETPAMQAEAKAFGIKHAQKVIGELEFKTFKREASREGLATHSLAESI